MKIRKIKINREVKHSSVYIISNFIVKFGSFLMVPLFWRKLTPSDYGIISVTEIIGTFLIVFLGLSLDIGITRFYYEWPESERAKRVGTLWALSWISSILTGLFVIFIGRYIFPIIFFDVKYYPYIFLGLLTTILSNFGTVVFATIRIKQMPILYNVLSISTFIMGLLLNIYFVLILDLKLYGLFMSNVISCSINILIISIVMSRFAKLNLSVDDEIKKVVKFSLPMIPTNLLSSLTSIADRFLLQQYATLHILGIYAICLRFVSIISSLHGALKMSYVPSITKIVSEGAQNAKDKIAKLSYYYLVPLILVGAAISIFIKEFIYYINQPSYFSVVNYVPFLVVSIIMSVANIYMSPGLFLAKRMGLVWIPSLIQVVMVVIGGVIFIPRYGIYGIIIYQYVSNIFFLSCYYYLSNKVYSLPFNWMKLLFVLLLTSIGSYVCNNLPFSAFVNILIKNVYILSIFFVLLNINDIKKFIKFEPVDV